MRIRHVILDRDGVLNRELTSGWVDAPARFEWEAGAPEALARLASAGIRVTVVTNQSGIGRGLVSSRQVETVNEWMVEDSGRRGGRIDAVLVCPHSPDEGCNCRKPAPGLVLEAVARSNIPLDETLLVGDDARDLEAGRRAGVRVALVRTGKGRTQQIEAAEAPVFDDLAAAVDVFLPRTSGIGIRAAFEAHRALLAASQGTVPAAIEVAAGAGGRRARLPALALTGSSPVLTSLANDAGYEDAFARQLEVLARPGDLLLAISTSGRSANVVRAAEAARRLGCATVALVGAGDTPLAKAATHVVAIPSQETERIQELHALCLHALAAAIQDAVAAPGVERR